MLRQYEMVMKAAADPSRLRILKMLENDELCVCQIVAVLGLSQSTVSKHLAILRDAGLLDERKDGRWVYYQVSQTAVNDYALPLLKLIKDWLKQDEIITTDSKRVKRVKKMDVEDLCCPTSKEAVEKTLSAA